MAGEKPKHKPGANRHRSRSGDGGPAARRPDGSHKTVAGLTARDVAVAALAAVTSEGRALDEALDQAHELILQGQPSANFEARDRALVRMMVTTALRRHGQIADLLARFIKKPPGKRSGRLLDIMRIATAQLTFMNVPAHAAIDLAIRQCKHDRGARHFDKLANAVLRRIAEQGAAIVSDQDAARLNTPDWIWQGWCTAYGQEMTARIAESHLMEAPLDISVKSDPEFWAGALGGTVLMNGSVRLQEHSGLISELVGFDDGAWWVQDAATALPAQLFGALEGRRVADLCAAPGGKTAQLATLGGNVVAVDRSRQRMQRLRQNLARLNLEAVIVEADCRTWLPDELFDCVLLDAPCSSTGTIRRHPDILLHKTSKDIEELTQLQAEMLKNARLMLKPGGTLIYCSCSLEPGEGPDQITAFLVANEDMQRIPIAAGEASIAADWLDGQGQLRTLPCHQPLQGGGRGGMDGFFAARLQKIGR